MRPPFDDSKGRIKKNGWGMLQKAVSPSCCHGRYGRAKELCF